MKYLLVALILAAMPALGDTIMRKDGSTVTGTIVSEDDKAVVLEVVKYGVTARVPVLKTEISEIMKGPVPAPASPATKPATPEKQGPSYYVIPISGTIGVDSTADGLKRALADARVKKPDYLFLVFDTPGGHIAEMNAMIDLLNKSKDLKPRAYVRRAISAGALLVSACEEVYMEAGATIGASVPYQLGPNGTPKDVEAKFRSAFLANARTTAELHGHSVLVVAGMIDADLELFLVEKDGKKAVVERAPNATAVPLKKKGAILSLTATEAVECGLAKVVLDSLDSAHLAFGHPQWHRMIAPGAHIMTQKGNDGRRAEMIRQAEEKRRQFFEKMAAELGELDRDIPIVQAKGKAAEDTLRSLNAQLDDEIDEVEGEYNQQRRTINAGGHPAVARDALLRRAGEIRDAKMLEIRRRFQPQIADAQANVASLAREYQRLRTRHKAIMDQAPKVPK
jgi:ATP-dependent protease ClpP protease subunit